MRNNIRIQGRLEIVNKHCIEMKDSELSGVLDIGRYVYQNTLRLKLIEHHYGTDEEPECVEYRCPICELFGIKYNSLKYLSDKCDTCGIKLLWEE